MSNRRVVLPTMHTGQVAAYEGRSRFMALRCGRRWGKTKFITTIACDFAAKGKWFGIFAPAYKITSETFNEIAEILHPIKAGSSRVDGVFRTISGGRIDFWTLEDDRAGRSRQYDGVAIDEAAFAKDNVADIWKRSIRPTLVDRRGVALVASTPNGANKENWFWQLCNDEPDPLTGRRQYGFTEYYAPSRTNPHLSPDELAEAEALSDPMVFEQEFLAEFVDWSGRRFFLLENCLEAGEPVPFPTVCDYVFATIDTATKISLENDGTAVCYWGRSRNAGGHPLVLLDWDVVQIEGATLETWLPTVFARLEDLSRTCRALKGAAGAWIEDKGSGSVLLQQAQQRAWRAHRIDSKLTALGKDERAINASPYVYQGKVKISRHAFDKVMVYKQRSANHLLDQVFTFRIGDKDAKRSDDLLDCFCYGIALALGGPEGF